jgi:hypothetical protein
MRSSVDGRCNAERSISGTDAKIVPRRKRLFGFSDVLISIFRSKNKCDEQGDLPIIGSTLKRLFDNKQTKDKRGGVTRHGMDAGLIEETCVNKAAVASSTRLHGYSSSI